MKLLPTVHTLAAVIDLLVETQEEVQLSTREDRLKLAGWLRELEVFRTQTRAASALLVDALIPADKEGTPT